MHKNERGSAQYGKRKDTSLPPGLDDVLNFDIIYSLRERLQQLRGQGNGVYADRLERVLLNGAPDEASMRRQVARHWNRAVFNASFVEVGTTLQERGVWPMSYGNAFFEEEYVES